MIKKLLIMLTIVCLVCSLVFALRGKDEIFSSTAILEILQESPQVPTGWITAIDSIKSIDDTFRFPRFNVSLTGIVFSIVQEGFYELKVPFIASIWNITIDAVKSICYVGTMFCQGIVYSSYFFAYLFA